MVRFRKLLLSLTLIFSAVCAVLIFRVNVNSDMTKYLPDGSRMKHGLEILTAEFGNTQMSGYDVRAMFRGLSEEDRLSLKQSLKDLPEVDGVTLQEKGEYALYELNVAKSMDQKAFGASIRERFGKDAVVETSQDGATPPVSVIIIAAILLLTILFIMCPSWLEPILFLASTGLGIVINIGTNAFLESVSITTNSIVAILQLVLSIDYSIILMNRYRQEKPVVSSNEEAMSKAVRNAAPSILSSAFTTIVGLLMLVFMNLKIGTDMGIVLSKGVLCSLICNFTVLPSLILAFDRLITASAKKSPSLPTNGLARFSYRFRIPLAIGFVLFFGLFCWLHNRTEISFSTNWNTTIDEIFPKKNLVVVLYENDDEKNIQKLLGKVSDDDNVEMVISYPSIMQVRHTAPDMVAAIGELTSSLGSEMPVNADMLNDDILRLLYYVRNAPEEPLKVSFPDLATFISAQAGDSSSLLSGYLDQGMREKIKMLNSLKSSGILDDITEPESSKSADARVVENSIEADVEEPAEDPATIIVKDSANVQPVDIPEDTIVAKPAVKVDPFADTTLIRKTMTPSEMASFLGMDAGQAKIVYRLAGKTSKGMTPLEFVHFMTDDVFKRKALASMISASQKEELLKVRKTMDDADAGVIPVQTEVLASAGPEQTYERQPAADSIVESVPAVRQEQEVSPTIIQPDRRLVLLSEMMKPNRKYTAQQMARNLSVLGEKIDAGMMDLLYIYYGCKNNYDEGWAMSLEEMLDFLSSGILADPRFSAFIDESMVSDFDGMKSAMSDGIGMMKSPTHSLAVIVSDYPDESPQTYDFVDSLDSACADELDNDYYLIGESVMFSEMKAGFDRELLIVTLLTVAAILLIVALTFKSAIIPVVLVMCVMSGVFVNLTVGGIGGRTVLYLAYLIVQSILMGATIDYGILFTNYYRESRRSMEIPDAVKAAYRGSINTIMTSGLIMVIAPGVMAILVKDVAIASIVQNISVGALAAVTIILLVLPGMLAALDRWVVRRDGAHRR